MKRVTARDRENWRGRRTKRDRKIRRRRAWSAISKVNDFRSTYPVICTAAYCRGADMKATEAASEK